MPAEDPPPSPPPPGPSGPRARVLVVDDEPALRRVAQYRLTEAGYEVALAEDGAAGLAAFEEFAPDLVITDVRMPGMAGDALAAEILRREPGLPVVVVTGHGSVADAVKAMRSGVTDYVLKPVSWDEMLIAVERALSGAALRQENRRLRSALTERTRFREIVGRSSAMSALFAQMERLLDVDTTVLLQGESGTGKELVARALHFQGRRAGGPFVAVNCGAIPRDLVESQLFGHERGAFTGAERLHRGSFEQAHGGTLFLDEIGDVPAPAQVSLLRVLTERRVTRVGGEAAVPVDVRVIAATNLDLATAVEEGDFRRDLYYRLAVVPLLLPALRQRGDDVVLLASAFLRRFAGRDVPIEPDAVQALRDYGWPGNVRELENAVEQAVVMGSRGGALRAADLPQWIREPKRTVPSQDAEVPPEGVNLEQIEAHWIRATLRKTGGNRTHAARMLGITRQALLYRMEKHGIVYPVGGGDETGEAAPSR
jgi:two-component system, NtrC family, response regulator